MDSPGLLMLIVDDRQDNLFVLREMIAEHLPNCEVRSAGSAAEGLQVLADTRIDTAVIDVQMPEMDGVEMCRRMKADDATANIPVLLITSHDTTAIAMSEALDAGADDFISRDVHSVELAARIRAALRIKRAEDELRTGAAREWETTFDAISDGVMVVDPDCVVVRCNRGMAETLGVTVNEVTGQRCCDVIYGASKPLDQCPAARARESRRRETLEAELDGRWWHVIADPILGEDGQVTGLVHTMSDITERKHAEAELRRMATVFMDAADPILIEDLSRNVVDMNEEAERSYGWSREELLGQSIETIIPPERPEQGRELRAQLRAGGAVRNVEALRWSKDRTRIPVLLTLSLITDDEGEAVGVATLCKDITAQKQVEGELQESEARYHDLYDHAPDMFCSVDAATATIVECNEALVTATGYARDEILGMPIFEIYHPDSLADAKRAFDHFAATGGIDNAELVMQRKDGSKIDVSLNVSALRDDDGQIIHSRSVWRDITERKASEAALAESEARHRMLFESTRDAVMILDDEAFLDCNQATLDLFGCATREEFLGKHPGELSPPQQPDGRDSRSAADERIATAMQEGTNHFEWLHCRVDGTEFPADVLLSRLELGEGPMLQAVVRDITEHRALEASLNQTSKLESVGTLAGGVAHDFNNILTGIIGYADIMRNEGLVGPEGAHELATIRELADRAANLTRQLLAFSRQQPMETKVVDPNGLIRELTKMLGRVIGEDVEVQLSLAADLDRISADPGQVDQVIMNLAVNARDAMPEGGTLTIETANVVLDEEYARSHAGVTPGAYVMLAISDSGHGIDAETQEHIFEPFFTTKEVGEGTGLGLATVYGIVKQHGGNIWVYSEIGKGTTFKAYLPSTSEEVDRPAPVASASARAALGETVLLVEDDPTVRDIAHRALVRHGYSVLVASDAGEAERVSTAYDDNIALLLSDVVMPGRTGPELYESLVAQRPGLRVLFMSGYPKTAAVSNGVLRIGRPFLQKPFTPTALAQKVREVLDAE